MAPQGKSRFSVLKSALLVLFAVSSLFLGSTKTEAWALKPFPPSGSVSISWSADNYIGTDFWASMSQSTPAPGTTISGSAYVSAQFNYKAVGMQITSPYSAGLCNGSGNCIGSWSTTAGSPGTYCAYFTASWDQGGGINYTSASPCLPYTVACSTGTSWNGSKCAVIAPVINGSISASPNPCTIARGASTCSTSISWTTTNVIGAWVKETTGVDARGAPIYGVIGCDATQYCGYSAPSPVNVPWISFGQDYTFVLYDHSTNVYGSVVVTGVCAAGTSWNGSSCAAPVVATCTDPVANNKGGPLPCSYCPAGTSWNGSSCAAPIPTCTGGAVWNGTSCACSSGTVWSGTSCATPVVAPVVATCTDPAATNHGSAGACTYTPSVWCSSFGIGCPPPPAKPAASCTDLRANNYGGALPCTYTPLVWCSSFGIGCPPPPAKPAASCTDLHANNYGGALPCTYTPSVWCTSFGIGCPPAPAPAAPAAPAPAAPAAPVALASCITPWGQTIVDGVSVYAFSVPTVVSPVVCPDPESRLCSDGSLSGSYTNSNCIQLNPKISINASNPRVHAGGVSVISWSATGGITSCTVKKNGSAWKSGLTSPGSGISDVVTVQTTYSIACDIGAPQSIVVNVVPLFQEF